MMASELLPPAQPAYVLRGHATQLHALHFTQENRRLLTGDADGWLLSWNLAFKRPAASWKAHEKAVLGIGSWGHDRIITHARDNKLIVWKLGPADENEADKILPVDDIAISPKQPWMLHMLTVNTLNFCSFAMCSDEMPQLHSTGKIVMGKNDYKPILIAVPNTVDSGGIDIYQLPSEARAAVILAEREITTGMVMALGIVAESTTIQVAAGYESGHTIVFVQSDPGALFQKLYCARSHTQPVLSMAIAPSKEYYLTSSADAILAKHPLPRGKSIWNSELRPLKVSQTKHSGQQGLQIRSDGMIFATAGWDARVRVYSAKTLKELAVLRWHKTGCYATAFAQTEISPPGKEMEESDPATDSGGDSKMMAAVKPLTDVQQRRDEKAQTTHWIAVGSKDGKVSLWDLY